MPPGKGGVTRNRDNLTSERVATKKPEPSTVPAEDKDLAQFKVLIYIVVKVCAENIK